MIEALMRIGDEVAITIPQENREWGYDPCSDGTRATVLGFSEIHYGRIGNFGRRPGVYVNRAWVNLRLEDGREHTEFSDRIELADTAEYEQRVAAQRARRREHPDERNTAEFIRELPETPFWEGDFVRTQGPFAAMGFYKPEVPSGHAPDVLQIVSIDYSHLTERTAAGTMWPAYNLSSKFGAGWYIPANEESMVLVERGPVWKFSHNEPLAFDTLTEEAEFFHLLGHTDEVPNPATGLYAWTKEEVLAAIRDGSVHGFSVSSGFLGGRASISARRFRDEELGRRVAQATLEGLGLVSS